MDGLNERMRLDTNTNACDDPLSRVYPLDPLGTGHELPLLSATSYTQSWDPYLAPTCVGNTHIPCFEQSYTLPTAAARSANDSTQADTTGQVDQQGIDWPLGIYPVDSLQSTNGALAYTSSPLDGFNAISPHSAEIQAGYMEQEHGHVHHYKQHCDDPFYHERAMAMPPASSREFVSGHPNLRAQANQHPWPLQQDQRQPRILRPKASPKHMPIIQHGKATDGDNDGSARRTAKRRNVKARKRAPPPAPAPSNPSPRSQYSATLTEGWVESSSNLSINHGLGQPLSQDNHTDGNDDDNGSAGHAASPPLTTKSTTPSLSSSSSTPSNTNPSPSVGEHQPTTSPPRHHQRPLLAPRDRKARNRAAATRCRLKTKAAAAALERDSAALARRHEALAADRARLRDEAFRLRNLLLLHAGCGCALIRQYLAGAARGLVAGQAGAGGEEVRKKAEGVGGRV